MREVLEVPWEPIRRRLEGALLLGALVAAVLLVRAAWLEVAPDPIGPDAWTFRDLVKDGLRHPYATGFREPLHCWVVRLLLLGGGTSDRALRGLSVALYFASMGIYYATTRKLFGRGLAAVCLFLYALAPKNAALAVEGLRNFEVVSMLCLVVLAGRYATERPRSAGANALAGVASGFAALTYVSLFLVTQVWLAASFVLARAGGWRRALVPLVAALLLFPHLLDNHLVNHDWFDTLNRHARFYRNIEYEGRPGMPTREERERDPYGGPPTSGLRYVLEGRTPGAIVATSALGFARWATYRSPAYEAYRTETFRHFGIPIWLACALGGALLVARRRLLWVPALVLACGIPFIFLLGIHQLDGRLTNDYLFAWLWLLAGFLPGTKDATSRPTLASA